MKPELEMVVSNIFQSAFPSQIIDKIKEAAQCKILFNLNNSIMTLIGHGIGEVNDIEMLGDIVIRTIVEGIETLKKANVSEVPVPNLPSWQEIEFAQTLPKEIKGAIFLETLKKLHISSMAQDSLSLRRKQLRLNRSTAIS